MAKRKSIIQWLCRPSEPPTQASLFHYIRDERVEPFHWKNFIGEIIGSFRSPLFIPSVFGDPDEFLIGRDQLRTRRMEAGLFSILVHASILLLAVLLIHNGTGTTPIKETPVFLNTSFFLPSATDEGRGGGGGGGGRREPFPPARGVMPDTARFQLLAPDPREPRPLMPAEEVLAATASVVMPIEIPLDPSLPVGDATAPSSNSRSAGPGTRGGIGTGDGTGVGPGKGPGYGPGENGGAGNGKEGALGNGGEGIYGFGTAGLRYPQILFDPKPAYTEEARRARVEGIVQIQAIVRKDGSVDSFRVIRGLGHGLDESAIQTIGTKWRFRPGSLNGIPVDVLANIEVSFRIY